MSSHRGARGQRKAHVEGGLKRTVTPAQGVALYVGAVVGAGVLVLPGTAASLAGPASVLAWAFVSVLGVPLALTFAALAGRYPDAGGVATFTGRAFGPASGAVVGWFYFFASSTSSLTVLYASEASLKVSSILCIVPDFFDSTTVSLSSQASALTASSISLKEVLKSFKS